MHLLDFIFVYSVILVMSTIVFTVFDINIHVVTIPRTAKISLATIITRVITIPLVLMMAVNFLQPSGARKPRWLLTILIWLGITVFDWALDFLKIITYQKPFMWHVQSTLVTYFGFIAIAWGCTWFYTRLDKKNVGAV
ncbi:hypothetical protein [Alicyclobacillus ferrooxydans]|uniref:hypothetical protein n=1 Tax=Alicyclobacillus ferrooxydans TaxID=471514 RepID=UPI0014701487|nr:hypothetical protein [Alicyclobacillus ferrooxydans]